MKKKFVFLGDVDSINIELINSSHKFLKNKLKYVLLGNRNDLSNYLKKLRSNLIINDIINPIDPDNYDKNKLNIFNIEDISDDKFKNLSNQIRIANFLSNSSKFDLVTLPINKTVFKKKIKFNGMTEFLSKINNQNTIMIMVGENFSVIPLTTHINLNDVSKYVTRNYIKKSINEILKQIKRNLYKLNFQHIKFVCFNPHCSEDGTLGNQDIIIRESISNYKKLTGPFSADSIFKNYNKNDTLFISMFHDQALIPFKILNQKSINLTLGLKYRRLSPAHGTAKDIKFKNRADITSYMACMVY